MMDRYDCVILTTTKTKEHVPLQCHTAGNEANNEALLFQCSEQNERSPIMDNWADL